jgi:hypothetical protein
LQLEIAALRSAGIRPGLASVALMSVVVVSFGFVVIAPLIFLAVAI